MFMAPTDRSPLTDTEYNISTIIIEYRTRFVLHHRPTERAEGGRGRWRVDVCFLRARSLRRDRPVHRVGVPGDPRSQDDL